MTECFFLHLFCWLFPFIGPLNYESLKTHSFLVFFYTSIPLHSRLRHPSTYLMSTLACLRDISNLTKVIGPSWLVPACLSNQTSSCPPSQPSNTTASWALFQFINTTHPFFHHRDCAHNIALAQNFSYSTLPAPFVIIWTAVSSEVLSLPLCM